MNELTKIFKRTINVYYKSEEWKKLVYAYIYGVFSLCIVEYNSMFICTADGTRVNFVKAEAHCGQRSDLVIVEPGLDGDFYNKGHCNYYTGYYVDFDQGQINDITPIP
mgnify:CR=1 FL=1